MEAGVSQSLTDGDSVSSNGTDWHHNACYEHYWKQYAYISSWIKNCQKEFSLCTSKPDFHEWCRLMCSYHATMAGYMQWNYLSTIGAVPQQLIYNWHSAQSVMQSRLPDLDPGFKFHKKCRKGRRRQKRQSQARKQSFLSSAADIELHIANIDPAGDGLDLKFGDANDNLEFEFQITEDLVKFFAETARHRKERGKIYIM